MTRLLLLLHEWHYAHTYSHTLKLTHERIYTPNDRTTPTPPPLRDAIHTHTNTHTHSHTHTNTHSHTPNDRTTPPPPPLRAAPCRSNSYGSDP